MTSRLKRKLNDLGVDTASSKANENFCLIGTPLPPLEKSKDTGEFVPLWKQEVKDEKGRRRLHGAFTGGFSAGYFNTVGSKEGWAPAEFTSSRSDRAKKKAARPEDFMDEEDLAELRDSQKLVDTTEEMDLDFWERKKADGAGEGSDSITSALEAALLPAPKDSLGAQILKKMGWRIGHGIGPKVTYEQRKRQDALWHAPIGSGGALKEIEDHEEAKKHLYPPRDTKVPVFKRKDNSQGLGYDPGMGLSAIVAAESAATGGNKPGHGPNISAGFGLGALNEADEDDLDVYDRGFAQTSRRLAYDEEEDDENIAMGSRSKITRTSSQASKAPVGAAGRSTFNNGLPCVPGFVVAPKPVVEENLFPPPVVPKGWTPNPRRVWEQDKENLKSLSSSQNEAKVIPTKDNQAWRRNGMTADERGGLLGETPLPAPPRSIFDYLAPKDRDRLKNLAAGRDASGTKPPSSEPEPAPGPPIPEYEPKLPRLDAQIAKMALQGFQPFTADPVKQARYTAYLKAQAAGEDSVPFSRAPGQAADSFMRELQDYARSAQIFKPASAAMANRFTRAAVVDTGAKAVEGLHHPAEEGSYLSTPGGGAGEKEPEKEESPKENAARLGMYGALTREIKPWNPARLLCKRFGVKEPVVELPEDAAAASKAASAAPDWQTGGMLAITDAAEAGLTGSTKIGDDGGVDKEAAFKSFATGGRRDIANIGLGDEDETQGRDILTYERPAREVYKSIFASDDEDDGNDEGGAGKDEDEDEDAGPQVDGETSKSRFSNPLAELSASTSTLALANPPPPPAATIDYNNAAGKVDLADFKPTFVPRSDRAKDKDKRDKGKEKDRKKKKGKSTLMSFEVDEDVGDDSLSVDREREKEKKRKKKKSEKKASIAGGADEDDESMWVEKPPPVALQNFVPPLATPARPTTGDYTSEEQAAEAGPPRGRKRAIDFM